MSRHFAHRLGSIYKQTHLSPLFLFIYFASIASCISSLKHLECLPGSRKGVGEKRGERSLFLSFARPALSREQGSSLPRVHPQLPTGSWGPGSFTLISLLGCLPGPVCGVREKRASDALSLLVLFLLVFLLSTVFAQTQDALPQGAEPDNVLLYLLDSRKHWIFESTLRHSPPLEESKNSPLPRFSGTSLGKAQWPQECQLPAVHKLAPPLPTARNCSGMSCSMTFCHTFGLVIEDFTAGTGFLIFGYGGFTLTFTSNCFAHTFPSLSARRGLSFSLMSCLHVAWDAFANLTLKNGGLYFPFSTSNCAIRCHDLLHMSNLHGSSLFHRAFYHDLTYGGCVLQLANLIAKNGSWNLPFVASNSDIRCYIWLCFCFASGLNLVAMGFYHTCNLMSVDCGGSSPPSEFWSWISSTLTLDGFHCPLRSSNCMLECIISLFTCHGVDLLSELLYLFTRNFPAISRMALSWLVFLTCIFLIDTCLRATSVHGSDDSTHESPLLNTCTHSTFSIDASLFIFLLLSTCIMSIDTCLLAICERGLDDSSHVSPLHLPTTCIHSTFSIVARLLFGIFSILIVATCMDAHSALGLDDFVDNSPLPTACTSSTLAFAIALLVSLHDLSVTESPMDSTLFRLFLLAVMLWQDASARVKGILLSLYYSFRWSASPQDSDESTGATCTFVRSIFGTSGSGRDSRNPPLPSSLWHFAIAIFHDIIVNLICITCKNSLASMSCLSAACREQIGMMLLCRQFTFHISLDDIDSSLDIEQSIQATCTSPRLDFTHLSSGWDLRSPPLPSSVTILTTQISEENAMTWASPSLLMR